jgi:hypothetical protein
MYATKNSIHYTFTLEKDIKRYLRQIKDLVQELIYSHNISRLECCTKKIDICQKKINSAKINFEIDYKKCNSYNLKLDSYRKQILKP